VGPLKFAQPRLGWWWWWLLLLLRVTLQMRKSLQHCLHQLVLVCNELFDLGVGLVIVVAALAVSVSPCVHHLRGF
jgi:hypothetical protein